MKLLKKIQEANRAGLESMAEHPLTTGVYGSKFLDKALGKAIKEADKENNHDNKDLKCVEK
jgi:O-acetyl-ADP-ribose deacetylase (regulator of RNase III)